MADETKMPKRSRARNRTREVDVAKENRTPERADAFFAPPPKWDDLKAQGSVPNTNVYHPREVTWADQEQLPLTMGDRTYEVMDEAAESSYIRKKRSLRSLWIAIGVVAVLCVVFWLAYQPLLQLLGLEESEPAESLVPLETVSITPAPVQAYVPSPDLQISAQARLEIAEVNGTLNAELYLVTEDHAVMRHARNGKYDYYVYSARDGRLLGYYEGLDDQDVMPLENGILYIDQAPYLLTASGSAYIRTENLEYTLGESVRLFPMYNMWCVVKSEVDGQTNYINAAGELISKLWFDRCFPMTGKYTLAYADTGITADEEQRFLLYVLGSDGTATRWLATSDMEDVLTCVDGIAFMRNGDAYCLPDTEKPFLHSMDVHTYPDCDALVARDAQSGKVGLWVNGEKHYDMEYDAILPLESDLLWCEKTVATGEASVILHALAPSQTMPQSISFALLKDGHYEYVALSTRSAFPVKLDDEY